MSPTAFPATTFVGSLGLLAAGACFIGALAVASTSDVRSRRIPNRLVVVLALLGLAFSMVTLGPSVGASRALIGFGIGFGLWIPFYALGMLGAGDVKLFAAACCWLAPSQAFGAAFLSAIAACRVKRLAAAQDRRCARTRASA